MRETGEGFQLDTLKEMKCAKIGFMSPNMTLYETYQMDSNSKPDLF